MTIDAVYYTSKSHVLVLETIRFIVVENKVYVTKGGYRLRGGREPEHSRKSLTPSPEGYHFHRKTLLGH